MATPHVTSRLTFSSPEELPTLDSLFNGPPVRSAFRSALKDAKVYDIVPLMLLNAQTLKIPHLATTGQKCITYRLGVHGIQRRDISISVAAYLERYFGSIEGAPISALNVAVFRSHDAYIPNFAPLDLVVLLGSQEPNMVIGDLMKYDAAALKAVDANEAVRDISEDVKHLQWRMEYLGLSLARRSRSDQQVSSPPRLHALS